jgi:hypothetical protein
MDTMNGIKEQVGEKEREKRETYYMREKCRR